MNELQVKTLEIEPAKINFNHEQIEKELDETLKKYNDLVFTEDSTTDLRSTLAYLRKGKNAINRYRIDTKKELNIPVNEFEEKCKSIESKFDSVIDPLNEQLKEFVERERAEKLKQLEAVKAELLDEYELDDDYAEQVEIDDSFLAKSTSIKTATDSIKFTIENLKMKQDKEKADKQTIEMAVRLANSENDLSLTAEPYIRLLEFDEVEVVQSQIEKHVQNAVEERESENKRKEQLEKEKQVTKEQQEEVKQPELIEKVIDDIPLVNDLPFGDVGENKKRNVTLGLIITLDQLERLKTYLEHENVHWEVHANENV